ncbi:archease [Candidatus Woesearchaeota archaeon]|nr:archease [Candidatus Woesearchaeota archaeon]
MKFRYFDHTADAMFESYGKTMDEAFANAGLAMFNILTDISKVEAVKSFAVKVSADTLKKLLFDFFDELLFLLDTEHMLFSRFDNLKIKGEEGSYSLECTAFGDLASKYETHGDIKAPTYNEMSIKKTESGVIIRAVVDI